MAVRQPTTVLEPIVAALARGDELAALDAAVAAWRVATIPAVAAVVEALSRRLEPHVPRPEGKLEELQRRWLALAQRGRAADLPALLATLTAQTERSGVAIVEAFAARAAAIARWDRDPRTTAGLLSHLRTSACFGAVARGHQPAWRQLFALVVRTGDPRALAALDTIDLAKVFRGWNDVAGRIAFVERELASARAALGGAPAPAAVPRALIVAAERLARRIAKRPAVAESVIRVLAEEPRGPTSRSRARAPDRRAAPEPAPAALEPALARAAAAIRAADDEGALAALLDAWRAWPAPELAVLVDAVSDGLDAQLPELGNREQSREALQTAWLTVAREQRPRDLPRLLRAVTATHFRSTDALARVRALARWPRDPRVAAAVAANFEQVVFTASSTRPFWSALIGMAGDHLDPRGAEVLAGIEARLPSLIRSRYTDLGPMRRWLARQLGDACVRGRAREERALPRSAAAACARLTEAIASRAAAGDRLLAEIYANPDADGPRAVYADRLQERGDVRGELIALQLAGRDRARQLELVARHGEAWLGALAPVCWVGGCRFERGFLETISLAADVDDAAIAARLDDPRWSTVRRLHLMSDHALPRDLLARLSLDHLGLASEAQLAQLAAEPRVAYRSLGLPSPGGELDRRRFAALREVELDGDAGGPEEWSRRLAPVISRLTTIAVSGIYELDPWRRWCAAGRVATLRIAHRVFDGGWLELAGARARAELGNPPDSGRLMSDRLTVGRLAALLATARDVRDLELVGRPPTERERAKLAKLVTLIDR